MKSRTCAMPEPNEPNRDRARSKRDVASIRIAADETDVARCPLCRAMLVARQGRKGPYFYCACVKTAA